jgi:FAD/FMN-containing dehydrogenase
MLRLILLLGLGCASAPPHPCKPTEARWPSGSEWQQLASKLTGKLLEPKAACESCENPWQREDEPGATQSIGWLDAWSYALSVRAVAAETPEDVAAAVDFARRHRLKVVIKGTGHDYLGRSNAPDSLLIWTHPMRQIVAHENFIPQGCSQGVPAVSLGAGTRWLEAYQEVTLRRGRYVQGGGCTSVGAAGGFILGGGFGSWSKKFGTGAAGLVEAEVVTADGKIRIANSCQNQDLFWALRGGGGSTFGVVTRVTLLTHALPEHFGFVGGKIIAKSDQDFVELLERVVAFYASSLDNEHWGEQIAVRGDNSLELTMLSQGLTQTQMEEVWRPLRAQLDDRYQVKLFIVDFPANKWWDRDFLQDKLPGSVIANGRPGGYYWQSNQGEVGSFWHTYQSRWLPRTLFNEPKRLAAALFAASRHWSLELHFNKGQAGAAAEAIARDKQTAMNPAVYEAAALVIVAANGHSPNEPDAAADRDRVTAAMKILRELTPGAGSYLNETDWFEPDWQRSFWGENYPRLLQIKRRYDPANLFTCHHCVGSE